MAGWLPNSEQAICLNCHRVVDFKWRQMEDGSKLDPIAPTRAVGSEADDKRADVTWVTLQHRCRCGTTLGCVVELTATPPAPPPV